MPPSGNPLSWLTRETMVGIASWASSLSGIVPPGVGPALLDAGLVAAASAATGLEAKNVVATVEVMAVALMKSRRLLAPFIFSDDGELAENGPFSGFISKCCCRPPGASSAVFHISLFPVPLATVILILFLIELKFYPGRSHSVP